MLAPQTCGSRSSRRISPPRVWRPPSAASPPAPGAGESKGPALQVFLRWLQTVGFWVGALLTRRFGGLLCRMWLFSVESAWCGPQTVGSSGSLAFPPTGVTTAGGGFMVRLSLSLLPTSAWVFSQYLDARWSSIRCVCGGVELGFLYVPILNCNPILSTKLSRKTA